MFGTRASVNFQDKIASSIEKNNSLLCVGLDPQKDKIPNGLSIFDFNKKIIDATSSFVCAYKPNIAFYEAEGLSGQEELLKTINYLQGKYPQIPIVLDAKRGDIENTAKAYAKSVFEFWKADAVTVYPYLGKDSLDPFLSYDNKLTILLLKTSNPDSSTFQNLDINGTHFNMKMAEQIKTCPEKNIGIFVGATYPQELHNLREIFPDKIFLSAGIGAQEAQIKEAVKAGTDKNGAGIMFNASRSIIYHQDPKSAAQKLRDEINKYRS